MSAPARAVSAALALPLVACALGASPAEKSFLQEATPPPAGPFDQEHSLWEGILRRHVEGDLFDYAALAAEPEDLWTYLRRLHAVTPEELAGWSDEQRHAFWINVYNAHTIQKVVESWPLESIRDLDRAFGLKSVFDDEFIPMRAHHPDGDDDPLSLNDVEHGILRPRFEDARVHAAINCASESCPPLRGEAFVGARLDEQLDLQMRAFVNDRERNRLDRDAGVARVSKIFDWFEEDFEREAGSVRAYLVRWARPEDRELLREAEIEHLDWSWDLNDVGSKS